MHCPGCGGHLTTSPKGYGHILGCGYPGNLPRYKHQEELVRGGPWDRGTQLAIIEKAFAAAKIEKPADRQIAVFAATLQKLLWARGPQKGAGPDP